jgi:DNA-directed RNA polymerase specialized sigma24 family protein
VTPDEAFAAHQAYLTHRVPDAEDLVGSMWVRAVPAWHQIRTDGETRAWLVAILRNEFRTELRRKRIENVAVAMSIEDRTNTSVGPGFDKAVSDKERIGQVLSRLTPEERRNVLAWAAGEVKFNKDLTSTRKVHIFRAVEKMRGHVRRRYGARLR